MKLPDPLEELRRALDRLDECGRRFAALDTSPARNGATKVSLKDELTGEHRYLGMMSVREIVAALEEISAARLRRANTELEGKRKSPHSEESNRATRKGVA